MGKKNMHTDTKKKYTNKLIDENSPYLLSHAHNPVNWYPWGEEALKKAKDEDKPIFLSIGYAACHWCHVMERESFENEELASILNNNFVAIKVDREQRPDLDEIYMSFTTAMTGSGGWPMSVFLTPDLKPFFAGTYFPPEDNFGRPGFRRVLMEIADAYRNDRQAIVESSEKIFDEVSRRISAKSDSTVLQSALLDRAAEQLFQGFDQTHGGFGQAPKFPHALELSLFLREYRRGGDLRFLQAAEKALKAMADGGIYDQIGGGFSRYSTDEHWLVPHFEKMLYDNALLVRLYAEGFQVTGNTRYREIVRETLDFMLREMHDESGGFYSELDADSEGEEGKFYLWTKDEIDSLLGRDEAAGFIEYFNVTDQGNFEGKNILYLTEYSSRLRENGGEPFAGYINDCRAKLLAARNRRERPLTDDKILTSWNGLTLTALCRGFRTTGDDRYLTAAQQNAAFVQETLFHDGQLTHSYREGRRSDGEFLEDYGYYIPGLLELFQCDGDARWLKFATELAERAISLFTDEDGRLYLRPGNQADLIFRPSEPTDGALPSSGSYLIGALLRLNRLTGKPEFLEAAEKALALISTTIERYPAGMTSALLALDYHLGDKTEIVIIGEGKTRSDMLAETNRHYLPNTVIVLSPDGDPLVSPLLEGKNNATDKVTAYVCRNSTCKLPVTTVTELSEQLHDL